MKAIICREYGAPDTLELGELPDPSPGNDEVLVEIHAAGVNYPDVLMTAGTYQSQPQRPFAPGIELAGTVVTAGPEIKRIKPGDKVMATSSHGAFAERMTLKERAVRPIPESMDLVTAAGFGISYGTAFHALRQRAQLAPDETLLVLGAGSGVGRAAVDIGNAMGARVIAVANGADKLEAAKLAGADHLIDQADNKLRDEVRELTGGKGADVIFDPIGGEAFDDVMRTIAWNGRVLIVGFLAGDAQLIPARLVLLKGCQIVGVFYGSFAAREPDENESNFDELFHLHAAEKIAPLVSETFPMAEYATALERVAARQAVGKLVLRIPR